MRRWPVARARRKPGELNKTEEAYQRHLEGQKMLGNVLEYWFEGMKLRLADNTFYTPDFFVLVACGELECHEVKGFKRKDSGAAGYYALDDSRVKIKVAAEMYPFRFVTVFQDPRAKTWHAEEV